MLLGSGKGGIIPVMVKPFHVPVTSVMRKADGPTSAPVVSVPLPTSRGLPKHIPHWKPRYDQEKVAAFAEPAENAQDNTAAKIAPASFDFMAITPRATARCDHTVVCLCFLRRAISPITPRPP